MVSFRCCLLGRTLDELESVQKRLKGEGSSLTNEDCSFEGTEGVWPGEGMAWGNGEEYGSYSCLQIFERLLSGKNIRLVLFVYRRKNKGKL